MNNAKTSQVIGAVLGLCGLGLIARGFLGPDTPGKIYIAALPLTAIFGIALLWLGVRSFKDSGHISQTEALSPAASKPGARADGLLLALLVLPGAAAAVFSLAMNPMALFYGFLHGGLEYMWPGLLLLLLGAVTVIAFLILLLAQGRRLPQVLMEAVGRHRKAAFLLALIIYGGGLLLFAPLLFGLR